MNVKRAKTAGFCFGVKRAVETVYEQAKNSDAAPIYTYGPIIHNEEVVKDLENQGVIVLRTEQELEQLTEGTVIIRSHGVAKYIYEKLEKKKMPLPLYWIRQEPYVLSPKRHLITINFKI